MQPVFDFQLLDSLISAEHMICIAPGEEYLSSNPVRTVDPSVLSFALSECHRLLLIQQALPTV